MRKLISTLAPSAIFLFITGLASGVAIAQTVPRPAGEFVIQHTNGQQLLLSSFKGKPTVIALMYATCSHCQHTSGVLSGIQQEYGPKGVQFLGATFGDGDSSRVDAFIKQFKVTFPVGYSNIPAVLKFLGLPENSPYFVPMLVFIDKKGIVRKQVVGDDKFFDEKSQSENIKAALDSLLKPASPVTSSKTAKKAPKS